MYLKKVIKYIKLNETIPDFDCRYCGKPRMNWSRNCCVQVVPLAYKMDATSGDDTSQ